MKRKTRRLVYKSNQTMNENQFKQAVRLFKYLGETKLRSGKNLQTELCLGQDISLWEAVASYMVLYRFPLLFSHNGGSRSWRERLKYYLRPYRGLMARFRDSVISPPRRTTMSCPKWPEGGQTVLFLGFVPTFYRDVLRPVAEYLATNGGIQVVVIVESQNPTVNVPANEKVQFQSLWEHWNNDTENLSKIMLRHLQTLQNIFFNRTQIEAVMQNIGGNFGSFALTREFYWLFWREFRRLIPQIAVAKHILDMHRPALIISADDADQRCRVYSLLARENGIPSLLVQQGLTSREYPEWFFFSQTAVAAMGQRSRADMISQGVLPEKIVLTGCPGFDHLALPEPDLCANIRKDLGVLDKQKMILFASQPYYIGVFNTSGIRKAMIKATVQVCNSLKDVMLVVKPHPGDNVHELKKFIGKSCQVMIVDRTTDISHLIKACDVFITFFSTSALQALYANKPVINVDFPGSGGGRLYSESGATWVARSSDEIRMYIQNLTGDDREKEMASREVARLRFLHNMVYLLDGQATVRISRVILNMLQFTY